MKARINLCIALIAIAAMALSVHRLHLDQRGLVVTDATVGTTPVTIHRLATGEAAPTVVIAHGFAGSRQLMEPFAMTLARNGFVAVTFDFAGHGRNPMPLEGSIMDEAGATRALVAELAAVSAFARDLDHADGRLALLGHSMAADIVVRHALENPLVSATVAVSMFSPMVTAEHPRNLLVITGALEPRLREEALRVLRMAAGNGEVEPGVRYGSFDDGSARRVAFSPGVEHVGVLYSRHSMAEALGWMEAVFGWEGRGYLAVRGPWILLLLVGMILLARPLSSLLPVVAMPPRGAGPGWRRLLPAAVLPAIATPLILWPLPTGFLPVLVADYLTVHFALYGVLTALCLWLQAGRPRPGWPRGARPGRLLLASLGMSLYCLVALGLVIDTYLTSFQPVAARWPLIAAMLGGTALYFLADEWLTRGEGAAAGGYVVTKLLFLASLGLAVALDVESLFFLLMIVPVMLPCFVVYGLFSRWVYRRTGDPLVAGIANALAFAWALAVTFPMLGTAA